ncbi:uncharacterized protein LOC144989542 isoform X2 [Oryzias latipes]
MKNLNISDKYQIVLEVVQRPHPKMFLTSLKMSSQLQKKLLSPHLLLKGKTLMLLLVSLRICSALRPSSAESRITSDRLLSSRNWISSAHASAFLAGSSSSSSGS